MKDEAVDAAVKKNVGLKSNKTFMFIDDSSEHKNAKCAKKILFWKQAILNGRIFCWITTFLRHLMNEI